MMRTFTIVFLLLTVSITFAGKGKISTRIIDAKTNKPIIKAKVRILEVTLGAYSIKDGIATIVNVPADRIYTIYVSANGYQERAVAGVKVKKNEKTEIQIVLAQEKRGDEYVGRVRFFDSTITPPPPYFDSSVITPTPDRNNIDSLFKYKK